MEVKPGQEAAVEDFLNGGLALVNQEPGTIAWFAVKLSGSTYGSSTSSWTMRAAMPTCPDGWRKR